MVEVTEAHKFATALIGVERFTADGNFHPDYLAMLDKYRQAGVQQGLDMAAGVCDDMAERRFTKDMREMLNLAAAAIRKLGGGDA